MSPSTVTALNVSATPRASSICSAGAAIGASVTTKASMVAMSGAIMPAPLAMPLMVTRGAAEPGGGGRDLGEGVGGHDCLGGVEPPARRRARSEAVHHRAEFARVERLADHAGGCEEDLLRAAPGGPCGDLGSQPGGFPSAAAGEGVGVARIDHERARRPSLEPRPAPFDRRRRAFGTGEDARDARFRIEHREHHIGAAGIADARCRRGELDAGDLGHGRNGFGCERGNGMRHARVARSARWVVSAAKRDQDGWRRVNPAASAMGFAFAQPILRPIHPTFSAARSGARPLDPGGLAQLFDDLRLRLADHVDLELLLHLVEIRHRYGRACPRP